MKAIIDTREPPEIVELFKKAGFEVESRYLETGDILVGKLLIERKTIQDFVGTMKTRRMDDQAARLNEAGGIIIIYDNGKSKRWIKKHDWIRKDTKIKHLKMIVPVFEVKSEEAFLKLIVDLYKKFPEGAYTRRTEKRIDEKDPVTRLYLGLPGVGQKSAKLLKEKYPVPYRLFEAMKKGTFKIKGIGPKTIKGITDLIYGRK